MGLFHIIVRKTTIIPLNSINQFVSVLKITNVFCEVGAEFLNNIYIKYRLPRVKIATNMVRSSRPQSKCLLQT
jgi:hypothetical protein